MKKIEPQSLNYQGHDNIEPLVAWVSECLLDLEYQGQAIVDDYWLRLKAGRKGHTAHQQGTLGLRCRRKVSGTFSLEWYGMGTLGTSRRSIAAIYIRKGTGLEYPLKSLTRHQPAWLADIVREVEEVLVEIRKKQQALMKIRLAITHYQAEVTGNKTTWTELITRHRAIDS